jgi:hypothetical protein
MHSCRRLLILGIVLGAGIATLSAQAANPRIGTWQLNVAKSKYSPGPAPKSQTLKIEASGQGEKVTSELTDAAGARTTTSYTANYDGKDYPLSGSPTADMVSLKRINARTSERVDKKGGKTVSTYRRVVSPDGKTMTVTIKGTNLQGKPMSNAVVFEKQ